MVVQYIHLTYEDYKRLEEQMKKFAETTHKTAAQALKDPSFYHKSIRLKITPELTMEFHGPLVRGG